MGEEPGRGSMRLEPMLPQHMARHAERTGVSKAGKPGLSLLILGGLAGAFIAFGATFATLVVAAGGDLPQGPLLLLGGVAFSLAYVLAILGGAELFTTNNLMVMAWASGKLSLPGLLRAWGLVFVGNAIGAAVTGALLVGAGIHQRASDAVGRGLLERAAEILALTPVEGFLLGVLGNALLCLGVWLTYSGTTATDRVLALLPPVAAFYALGLEHAIAVLFYLPVAVAIRCAGGAADAEPVAVTLASLFGSLLPVTVGNIIGGGLLVALVYWFVYLRGDRWAGGNEDNNGE